MGYEHHEMPPIYFGGSAARRATQTAALAPSAARQMQLWGWNMGYEHHEQLPPSTFGDKKQSPGDAQKLWMFKSSYPQDIAWPTLSRAAVLSWPTAVPNNHHPATSLCARVD